MQNLFYFDLISAVMITLICFVSVVIYFFSKKYMQGDPSRVPFLWKLILVCCITSLMVVSDNLFFVYFAAVASNALLVRLMIHNGRWQAAVNSGMIAAQNFIVGALFLAGGFISLYLATGQLSIQSISRIDTVTLWGTIAKICILLAAFTQSAVWPFHRWLISSLNSPTPVSAMMHAGLINGGGFLLVRFSFLYINSPVFLTLIFIVGFITACIGTVWKLMQNDIKRMLACSTMGQMGFMFVECGLGLFSVAMLHLFLHGLFKAYLFLGSGGALHARKIDLNYPPTLRSFLLSLVGGIVGCYGFAIMSDTSCRLFDANIIILSLVFMLFTQFMLSFSVEKPGKKMVHLLVGVFLLGSVYGGVLFTVEHLFDSPLLLQPQSFNFIHFLALVCLYVGWIGTFFVTRLDRIVTVCPWLLPFYVTIFNASQPHASTVTSNHNAYTCLK